MLSLEKFQNKLKDGKIFSVVFIKKDGTLREMTARLGVKKHLKGGTLTYNPKEHNNMIVFDMGKKQYRTIPFDRVVKIKANNEVYFNPTALPEMLNYTELMQNLGE